MIDMTDTLQQIKKAFDRATNSGKWIHNGNEFVAESNSRVGIGGFLTNEDNDLVQLLVGNAQALIDEIEKLRNISDARFVFFSDGREEDLWGLQERNMQLEAENTAMKEALEFYAAESTYDIDHLDKHGYIIIDQDGGEKARNALSSLSPKEGTPND